MVAAAPGSVASGNSVVSVAADRGQRDVSLAASTVLAGLAVLATWIWLLPRAVPDIAEHDRGVFVSVAERLLAGDRLYSGVFDNKEPLFFYLLAGQRTLGAWADVGAELVWLLIASLSAFVAARQAAGARTAVLVGFIVTPLLLTGGTYIAGHTHLPGIALALAAYALALQSRAAAAGVCLGLLLFLKLTVFPVAVALVAVAAFMTPWRPAELLRLTGAALAAAGLVIALLGFRGELCAFVATEIGNVAYAQGDLIGGAAFPASLREHLVRVSSPDLTASGIAIVCALTGGWLWLWRGTDRHNATRRALTAAGASFAVTIAVLALTGLWEHHGQAISLPAVLVAVALAGPIDPLFRRSMLAGLAACIGFAILAAPLGADRLAPPFDLAGVADGVTASGRPSPYALALTAMSPTGTYARLGQNDVSAHAMGLRGWTLACPRFHQYFFQSAAVLGEALDCAAKTDVVVIDPNVFEPHDRWPGWVAYGNRVAALLATQYACRPVGGSSGGQICVRRAGG